MEYIETAIFQAVLEENENEACRLLHTLTENELRSLGSVAHELQYLCELQIENLNDIRDTAYEYEEGL